MVGLRLALIGSINDEILNADEMSLELIGLLTSMYPGMLSERYGVDESEEPVQILYGIAENRKCIGKGGELNYSKAAVLLIDDFRSGALGQITLEQP
jgi:ribosome biogenesis GTPase A